MRERPSEFIELRAANPDGDLACDFEIASEKERTGLHEELARGLMGPVRDIPDGVEARFRDEAWDAVRRYVDLESRCCSFLTLTVGRRDDGITLRVTGRPEAVPIIRAIFADR
jgi:hypothetical protein